MISIWVRARIPEILSKTYVSEQGQLFLNSCGSEFRKSFLRNSNIKECVCILQAHWILCEICFLL